MTTAETSTTPVSTSQALTYGRFRSESMSGLPPTPDSTLATASVIVPQMTKATATTAR